MTFTCVPLHDFAGQTPPYFAKSNWGAGLRNLGLAPPFARVRASGHTCYDLRVKRWRRTQFALTIVFLWLSIYKCPASSCGRAPRVQGGALSEMMKG